MPSISIFVHDLSATGVVRNALAIARHMQDKEGWQVRLILGHEGGDLVDEAEGLARHPLLLPDEIGMRRSHAMLRAVPRLRALLKQDPPDILLSAGNHAHLPCWLATRGLKTPLRVYRMSNDLSHNSSGLSAIRRRQVARWLVRDAARLVLVSPNLAQEPVLDAALASGKACVIRNGVPLGAVAAQKDEPCDHPWFASDIPVVVSVGRLVTQKNFPTLVHALAEARQTREIRLILLGGGAAARRAELEHLARELGVSDAIDFVGRLANPFPYAGRATVLALPSLWEGSANVLLEAMACGTPVIASRTAGNAAEVLDQGRYGLLVDPMDSAAMAKAILQQCDPVRRVSPGTRAAEFDIRRTLSAYAELFSTLAARVRRNAPPIDRSAPSQFRYR